MRCHFKESALCLPYFSEYRSEMLFRYFCVQELWATESSKAFSLQTDREHPQRGSVTRIRVRCWTQSVRTTWRTRSHGTVCVDPRTGENHQLVPDYWDIWTLSDCEDGATQQSQLHAPQHNECASDLGRVTAFLWLWMELVHVEQFNVSSWTWALSPPPLLPVRLHSEPRSLTRSEMIQRESPGDSFRSDRAGDEWHSAQLLFSLQQEYSTTLTSAKKHMITSLKMINITTVMQEAVSSTLWC